MRIGCSAVGRRIGIVFAAPVSALLTGACWHEPAESTHRIVRILGVSPNDDWLAAAIDPGRNIVLAADSTTVFSGTVARCRD